MISKTLRFSCLLLAASLPSLHANGSEDLLIAFTMQNNQAQVEKLLSNADTTTKATLARLSNMSEDEMAVLRGEYPLAELAETPETLEPLMNPQSISAATRAEALMIAIDASNLELTATLLNHQAPIPNDDELAQHVSWWNAKALNSEQAAVKNYIKLHRTPSRHITVV
jgi:hypothetical protein